MRQLVLVVVLVGAAFLGGAFVNGPGLRWVQTQVLGSMGLDDGGEIATVDLKAGANAERANPGELVGGPVAPEPGLVEDSGAKAGPNGHRATRREAPEVARTTRPSPPARSATSPTIPDLTAPSDPPPLSAPSVSGDRDGRPSTPVTQSVAPTHDPEVTRAAGLPTPASAGAASPSARNRESGPAIMDSLASLMPTPAPAPPEGLAPPVPSPAPVPSSPSPSPAQPAPGRAGDEDWAALARKMQALGISRFTIEGQPGGRAVFSCLIPLAGRQAVTQRFEADGEDALQAARAALRRVALWRAAQPTPTQPR